MPSSINTLIGGDLEHYQRHLLATFANPQYRQGHRSAVRYLWRLRHVLGDHALPFDPRHVPGWGEGSHQAPTENTTDRIPEQVHAPLLVWALRFIDDFGPDILAALDAWRTLRGPTGATSRIGQGRNTGLAQDLRHYLDDHLTHHRPLPGYQGKPNIRAISLDVRCSTRPLQRQYRNQIDAVAAKVGITPYARVNIPIAGRIDGQPWLDDIAVEPNADNGMSILARMLQAACYLVIAFLSGMRDCEKPAELHLMQHSSWRDMSCPHDHVAVRVIMSCDLSASGFGWRVMPLRADTDRLLRRSRPRRRPRSAHQLDRGASNTTFWPTCEQNCSKPASRSTSSARNSTTPAAPRPTTWSRPSSKPPRAVADLDSVISRIHRRL